MGFSAFSGAIGTRTGVRREVWIDAAAITPATTNGAETATEEDSNVTLDVLKFDGVTAEFGHFRFRMQEVWDLSTVRATVHWDGDTGASPGDGVVWTLAATAASDGDARDVTFTPTDIPDTLQAVGDVSIAAAVDITVQGTPQRGDQIFWRIGRDPDDGADNMPEDAKLMAVWIQWIESVNEPTAI